MDIIIISKKICIFTLISILFSYYPANAEYLNNSQSKTSEQFKEKIISGIEFLYDMEFEKAEAIFSEMIENDPHNPAQQFYYAMISWSKMSFGFWDSETLAQYKTRIERTIKTAEKQIDIGQADGYTYFYLGGALGYKGRLKLMQQKWFSSYVIALKAIKALKTCQKMDPNNKDALLGLGMYNYYTAQFSGILKFITAIFLHKGDKVKGLKELHQAANEAVYSSVEAKSLLLYIYLFLETDYEKARPLAEELAERFKNNPSHSYNRGISYISLNLENDYHSVLSHFQEKADNEAQSEKASLWQNRKTYLEASFWLFKGRYGKAREQLELILLEADHQNDPSMIAWPTLKIGISYDLENNREKAYKYYQKVYYMKNGAGAQFLAEKYLMEPIEKDSPFILF